MKLATYKGKGVSGDLQVVSDDLQMATSAAEVAGTLQEALNDWSYCYSKLHQIYQKLNEGEIFGSPFEQERCQSPLAALSSTQQDSPCPFGFKHHKEELAKEAGSLLIVDNPLLGQQRLTPSYLAPHDAVLFRPDVMAIDYVATIAIITASVPRGVDYREASDYIRLVMIGSSMRLPSHAVSVLHSGCSELTSYSPLAITPGELGVAWENNRVHFPLFSYVNGQLHAQANSGQAMSSDFAELIVLAAQSTSLAAGTIISTPLLSSSYYDQQHVDQEQFTLDELDNSMLPLLHLGDQLRIEMFDYDGQTVFGAIDQRIEIQSSPY